MAMRAPLLFALVSLFALTAAAQSAEVSLAASATQVSVGEPFAVEIRASVDGGNADDVDLPDLSRFEVLGRRESHPVSFSFGFGSGGQHAVMKSEVVYSFTLRASQPGTYRIAPAVVTVGRRKFKSQSLSIEVVTGGASFTPPGVPTPTLPGSAPDHDDDDLAAPPEGSLDGALYDPDMFLRTVVDNKEPHVGEQATVTIYLYVRGRLQQTPTLTREPTADGFWVQDLLPAQRSLSYVRQEVNGRAFNVYVLRRFAAFPLRAGALKIGAPWVEVGGGGSIFDLLSGPSAPTRRKGLEVAVAARELPAHPGPWPVHVGELTLEASVEPAQAKVGDAVTLRVVARGTGNLRALELAAPRLANVDVLPPELDDQLTTELDRVGGQRTFRWLLLPRTPGRVEVPAFGVDVFDPARGGFSAAKSAALSFEVTGSAVAPPAAVDTPSAGDEAPHFGPARTTSALLRRTTPLDGRPWFRYALGAGPLLLALLFAGRLGVRGLRARRASTEGARKFRDAQARLDEAQKSAQAGDAQAALGALASALKRALEARLEEPVGGLTRAALRAHLVGRGMGQPLAERIVAQLEGAELARFDPTPRSRAELETEVEKARGVLRELDRFVPKGTP